MKKCKKLLLVLVCSIVLLLALGISANAQDNDPQLPKSFRFNDGYTAVSLTDFEIYDVYYNPTWDGSLIMEYYAYFNDDIAPYYLQMNFMDANYNVVTTAKLERGWNEVVIPGNSAMFSIVFIDGYYGRQEGSDSYVPCKV